MAEQWLRLMGAGIIWKLLYLHVWYVDQASAKAGLRWSCWQEHIYMASHVDVLLTVWWLGSEWKHPKRRENLKTAWWKCMAFGDLASEITECSFCSISAIKAMTGAPLFKERCYRSHGLIGAISKICDCFLNYHNIQFTIQKVFFSSKTLLSI